MMGRRSGGKINYAPKSKSLKSKPAMQFLLQKLPKPPLSLFAVLFTELIHTAGSINNALLAGVKRMA